MVFADSMAMGFERSKPLHNFTLPFLKWGNQRYLRCMKLDSDADADLPPPSAADRRSPSSRKFRSAAASGKRFRASKYKIRDNHDADEGIAAVREKLMFDLKTAADKMKVAFWTDGVVDDDDVSQIPKPAKKSPTAAPPSPPPPWSLRARRTASKAPIDETLDGRSGEKEAKTDKRRIRNSPMSGGGDGSGGVKSPGQRREREKFSISLSRREIEEDFMALTERRPPRRPKKRPRIVQNQIDMLFPGSWLTEITADLYDVPEIQKTGKR